jgi:biopolymer transport protein ExbD
MKLVRTVHFHPALATLVPLVTVMFLVLMCFALSSRYVLQPGVAANLPVSPFFLGPQRNPQILSIIANPAVIPVKTIYFRDRKYTISEDDQEVEVFKELEQALAKPQPKERTLVIKADRGTPYEFVVKVMNLGLHQEYAVVLAGNEADPGKTDPPQP